MTAWLTTWDWPTAACLGAACLFALCVGLAGKAASNAAERAARTQGRVFGQGGGDSLPVGAHAGQHPLPDVSPWGRPAVQDVARQMQDRQQGGPLDGGGE